MDILEDIIKTVYDSQAVSEDPNIETKVEDVMITAPIFLFVEMCTYRWPIFGPLTVEG